ncbi:MAG: aspartate aminotransferase family protein [Gammaproteobacteria bacterium]|nr:aspartate aminotransferase family protein [Gammaproteobacteria bacterium]MBI5614836.1 aspartate aminotransferase family protein [Gammaproteobacteria bacterium]
MSPDEFRRAGHTLVDWIADYRERVATLPVQSQVEPGALRAALPASPPEHGDEGFDAWLRDVDELVLPGITHWQAPAFFAYFPANTSGPSILGELLSAGLGVQGMLWATSPACTELETHMLDWLVDLMALPEKFRSRGAGGGVLQDSASSAVLCALLAARERATRFESNTHGGRGGLVAYGSTQTHSSLDKGIAVAGIGRANLRKISVDERFAMDPQALAAAIAADRAAGRKPFFVCATVGTTSTLAADPLRAIGEICAREGLWLHVDAAMAGSAAVCPEHRVLFDGLELADSYCFNPHKWLFTNFDCSAFFVADRKALTDALSITPEYLRNAASESGGIIDYRDWQIPLGRRFRALKLWFVIRHYGAAGLRHHLRRHIALAAELGARIAADPHLELAVPVSLNLVCFRHRRGDEASRALLARLNAGGRMYLSHTVVEERHTLRLCIGQTHVAAGHVETAWQEIAAAAAALNQGVSP